MSDKTSLQSETSFNSVTNLDQLLCVEKTLAKSDSFRTLDELTEKLTLRTFRGELSLDCGSEKRLEAFVIEDLDAADRAWLSEYFDFALHQKRGSWHLPEKVTLDLGPAMFFSRASRRPKFAAFTSDDKKSIVSIANSPEAIYFYSVLGPLLKALAAPLLFRTGMNSRFSGGTHSFWLDLRARCLREGSDFPEFTSLIEKSVQSHRKNRSLGDTKHLLDALGIKIDEEFAVLEDGLGWLGLPISEKVDFRKQLLMRICEQFTSDSSRRYRAYQIFPLINRYYKKAKNGVASKKGILTGALAITLTGYFGGDWQKFLDYLGELPHPEDELISSLPESRLLLGGVKSASEISAETHAPVDEVEKILATFWDSRAQMTDQPGLSLTASPTQQRVAVLRDYWFALDEVHARQKPGMPGLWGLSPEKNAFKLATCVGSLPSALTENQELYETLLPRALLEKIDFNWSGRLLPKWPERIVSNIFPLASLCRCLGVALQFWIGSALTAWFVCEGHSRTDIQGLGEYYLKPLQELERMGCPVNTKIFSDLKLAAKKLGPARQTKYGVSRHDGFEHLRDVLTEYRGNWADEYLEIYLGLLWEEQIKEGGKLFSHRMAEKSKAPTVKQVAKDSETLINSWFGGSIASFYVAIGERCPITPQRSSLMPKDRIGFIQAVYQELGGGMTPVRPDYGKSSRAEQDSWVRLLNQNIRTGWFAEQSLVAIQIMEATDKFPALSEFGSKSIVDYNSQALAKDVQSAWTIFQASVQKCLKSASPRYRKDESIR